MKLISIAAVVALTSTAAADSRSWSAVKGMLPENVNIVVGANMSALRGTSIYQSIVPMLIAKEPDAQKAIDLAKSTCSIDLHAAIVDATFALGEDERGVVVVALDKSIDQKRVLGCVTKLVTEQTATRKDPIDVKGNDGGLKAGAKKPPVVATKPADKPAVPKLVTKTTGKVTEYGLDNDPQRLYVAWLAADVVALATDPDDKALLDKMLAGKGTKGTLNAFLAKASPNAAVWLATTKAQPIQTGGTMKGAFGTVDTAKGNVNVDVSIVMASSKEAKGLVEQLTSLIASAKSAIPPQFQKLVDALRLSASADAANLKVTASEKDLLGLISVAVMNL